MRPAPPLQAAPGEDSTASHIDTSPAPSPEEEGRWLSPSCCRARFVEELPKATPTNEMGARPSDLLSAFWTTRSEDFLIVSRAGRGEKDNEGF